MSPGPARLRGRSGTFLAGVLAALSLAACGDRGTDIRWDFSDGHESHRVSWPKGLNAFHQPARSVTIALPGARTFRAAEDVRWAGCFRDDEAPVIHRCTIGFDRMAVDEACAHALALSASWHVGTSNTRRWCREAKAELAAGGDERHSTILSGGGLPPSRPIGGRGGPVPDLELQTLTSGGDDVHDEAVAIFSLSWSEDSRLRPAATACAKVGFTPNSDDVADDIRAQGTTCATARALARASYSPSALCRRRGTCAFRSRGFACRGHSVQHALPYARWRCTRGAAVVRFIKVY